MIDFKSLAKAGVHFGHQTSRWNPKMAPFIWGQRSGIHLIDVSKTAIQLEKAANFLEKLASEGKQILWVGTKKSAQLAMAEVSKLNMPAITTRWVGGTLTNRPEVRKAVTKLLHLEDVIAKSEQFPYTKKELVTFQKNADRLDRTVGGIRNLRWPIGAVVLVDVRKEQTALREATALGVPVVALVDTNGDPSLVNYVIPGNDDAPKAVKIIVEYLTEAVKRGTAQAAASKIAAQEAAAEEAAVPAAAKATQELHIPGFEEVETEEQKAVKKPSSPRRSAAPKN